MKEGDRLAALRAALRRLTDALKQPKSEWTRDAAIQRFEFTFELAWKAAMHFAVQQGLECVSPRQALQAAHRLGWIRDEEMWLDMLEDRNRTSHTYNEATAEEIYSHLDDYAQAIAALIVALQTALLPPASEK
jgi:nucleotidyltransferase substrate binding protein (TIGR01987 family)